MDHPYIFFLAYFVLSVSLGMWLDQILLDWQLKRLRGQIDLLKLELKGKTR